MARPLRMEQAGGWRHVTSRGNEGKALFRDDRDRERFCELLGEMAEAFGLGGKSKRGAVGGFSGTAWGLGKRLGVVYGAQTRRDQVARTGPGSRGNGLHGRPPGDSPAGTAIGQGRRPALGLEPMPKRTVQM